MKDYTGQPFDIKVIDAIAGFLISLQTILITGIGCAICTILKFIPMVLHAYYWLWYGAFQAASCILPNPLLWFISCALIPAERDPIAPPSSLTEPS